MELIQQQVQAWKWLSTQVKRIQDPTLRNAIMAEFRKRAMREWGYCPETATVPKNPAVELEDWEKEFVSDIEKTIEFELDVSAGKRQEAKKEALARMKDFINKGGSWFDFPADLRNEHTAKLYNSAFFEIIGEALHDLEKNEKNT